MRMTPRQIECFMLVQIRGFTHKQAAEILGVSRQHVTKTLRGLYEHRPELGEINPAAATAPEIVTYSPAMDYKIKEKF